MRKVITVWKDGSWRIEQELDAVYVSQNDPDWLVTIPLDATPVA